MTASAARARGAASWPSPSPALVAEALTRPPASRSSWSRSSPPATGRSAPVAQLGVGVFVSALRDALLAKEIDFAVHSYKDLPTAPADGLVIAAVPPRGRPARRAGRPRRPDPGRARRRRPDRHRRGRAGSPSCTRCGAASSCVPIRGNVDTRLRKVADGELDAVDPGAGRHRPARPRRRDHRDPRPAARCCRPPRRARWPWSAGPTTPRPSSCSAALDDADSRAAVDRRAGAARHAGGRLLRTGRRAGRGRRGRRRAGDLSARCRVQPGRHAMPSGCRAPGRSPTPRRWAGAGRATCARKAPITLMGDQE